VTGRATDITLSYQNVSGASLTTQLYERAPKGKSVSVLATDPYVPNISMNGATQTVTSTVPNDLPYSEVMSVILPLTSQLQTIEAKSNAGEIVVSGSSSALQNVTLTTNAGRVVINPTSSTVLKKIMLHSNAGSIVASNLPANSSANLIAQAGSIAITNASNTAKVNAQSNAGSITYQGAATSVEASTNAGSINIANSFTSVNASTNAGGVRYNGVNQKSPFLLNVSSNYAPVVILSTNAGSIHCNE